MPKSVVRKDPDPDPEPEPAVAEEKSDTVGPTPYKVEEKDQEFTPGPAADEMKTAPAAKTATRKEPEPEEEDDEFEDALKLLGERFDRMEKAILGLGEILKATYTSKPKDVASDYPVPPDQGPKSDGLQGPKLTQQINEASKPFGKSGKPVDVSKSALKGAADGAVENPAVPGGTTVRDYVEKIIRGETSIAKMNAEGVRRA